MEACAASWVGRICDGRRTSAATIAERKRRCLVGAQRADERQAVGGQPVGDALGPRSWAQVLLGSLFVGEAAEAAGRAYTHKQALAHGVKDGCIDSSMSSGAAASMVM